MKKKKYIAPSLYCVIVDPIIILQNSPELILSEEDDNDYKHSKRRIVIVDMGSDEDDY